MKLGDMELKDQAHFWLNHERWERDSSARKARKLALLISNHDDGLIDDAELAKGLIDVYSHMEFLFSEEKST